MGESGFVANPEKERQDKPDDLGTLAENSLQREAGKSGLRSGVEGNSKIHKAGTWDWQPA